jgi:hypothetical protein
VATSLFQSPVLYHTIYLLVVGAPAGAEINPELRGDVEAHGFWKRGATTTTVVVQSVARNLEGVTVQ